MEAKGDYIPNYYSIKKYNDNRFKLVLLKYPKSNIKIEKKSSKNKDRVDDTEESKEEKERCHLSRARSKIFDYAMCNNFAYFVTLTLDPKKYDRTDLDQFIKDFGQFIRNYRKKTGLKTQYLLIPELHADNESWHMHGLINGLDEEDFIINKNGYNDWVPYSEKFGYISISRVVNSEAVAKYITKYITKSIDGDRGVTELNKKLYYVTRGLKLPDKVKEGTMTSQANLYLQKYATDQFENDYIYSMVLDSVDYEMICDLL